MPKIPVINTTHLDRIDELLVDNEETLEKIFSSTKMLIAVHCEDETTIKNNLEKYKNEFGNDVPVTVHHLIRSEEACYLSSSKAIAFTSPF
jgi:dihydroorotase